MTFPPSDRTPAIPGSSSWQAGAQPAPPIFTAPNPRTAIDTGQFELARWAPRAAATIIDMLLRLLIAAAISVVAWMLLADDPFSWAGGDSLQSLNESDFGAGSVDDVADFNALWFGLTVFALYYVTALFYAPITMRMWRGATPGKRLLRMRVIREEGRDLTFGEAFVREVLIKGLLVNVIGGTIFLAPLLNYLWPLWERECRAGHDFLAHTRVVRTTR